MSSTWWVSPDSMDKRQRRVQELPLDEKSHHLKGPPGCGKTNLLLLRANYSYLSGITNICIIVFTRVLKEFVAYGANQYDFPTEKIMTYAKWARKILYENGIPIDDIDEKDDYTEIRKTYSEKLLSLIEDNGLKDYHETIFIDEGQDYTADEFKVFSSLAKNIFFTSDLKQQLYTLDKGLVLDEYADEGCSHTLEYHYRNGENICKLADLVVKKDVNYELMRPKCNYKEKNLPSFVYFHECSNTNEEFDILYEKLCNQLDAYPNEMIGIICMRNETITELKSYFSDKDIFPKIIVQESFNYQQFDSERPICIATINSLKGLEFRAAHIVSLEKARSFPQPRNKIYTAITRAQSSLSLYYSSEPIDFMQQAITDYKGARRTDVAPEDAFGGK